MSALAYLIGLCCALPFLLFALAVCAFGRAVGAQDVFELFWGAAVALVWGIPLVLGAIVALFACGVSARWRAIGAAIVIALNLVALVTVLRVTGAPSTLSTAAMLGPTVVSCWLHMRLLLARR